MLVRSRVRSSVRRRTRAPRDVRTDVRCDLQSSVLEWKLHGQFEFSYSTENTRKFVFSCRTGWKIWVHVRCSYGFVRFFSVFCTIEYGVLRCIAVFYGAWSVCRSVRRRAVYVRSRVRASVCDVRSAPLWPLGNYGYIGVVRIYGGDNARNRANNNRVLEADRRNRFQLVGKCRPPLLYSIYIPHTTKLKISFFFKKKKTITSIIHTDI